MDTKKVILEIMKEFVEDVPDKTNANLVELGIIDSMVIMNLLISFEKEFSFEIDVKDINQSNFESIDNMAEMVERYIKI